MTANKHQATVEGFGDEWERFDQSELNEDEYANLFERYFSIFPWDELPDNSTGFDMGCGSGRWAKLVAPRVGKLHCIDPSSALNVAKNNLSDQGNCLFHKNGVSDKVLSEQSMDFGYSLGVLHHVPDTAAGIRSCVEMLKPNAPFLIYLYYSFDNRPFWFRSLWRASDLLRRFVSRLPHSVRYWVSQFIALTIYWPLARISLVLERLGCKKSVLEKMPLSGYRKLSLYTMRTDALDRFGTRLEQRFSRVQITQMLEEAGLENIHFSEDVPYWCAVGTRKA